MKTHVKSFSILAISGLLSSAAIAGPGAAYGTFGYNVPKKTESVEIALFRANTESCKEKCKDSVQVQSVNPKTHGSTFGKKYGACMIPCR